MPLAVKRAAAQAAEMIEANRMARLEATEALMPKATPDPEPAPEATPEPTDVLDATPAPEPAPEPEVTDPEDGAAVWEQRWRSLDGQLRARDRQITQMQDIITSMQSAPAPAPAPAPEAPSTLSMADKETFGEDLVDMVQRASRAEASTLLNTLTTRLDKLERKLSGVETTAAATAHESFEGHLTRLVPNWETLNYDAGFISWLQASPARNKVFQAAATERDAATVAEFFLDYGKRAQPAAPVAPGATPRQKQLAKQVAPGKGRTVPVAPEPEPVMWTRTSITALYANKKDLPKDEFKRLEADMFAAQREGRVDYNK